MHLKAKQECTLLPKTRFHGSTKVSNGISNNSPRIDGSSPVRGSFFAELILLQYNFDIDA